MDKAITKQDFFFQIAFLLKKEEGKFVLVVHSRDNDGDHTKKEDLNKIGFA